MPRRVCPGALGEGALQIAQEHGRSTIECPGSLREGALQSAQEHWGREHYTSVQEDRWGKHYRAHRSREGEQLTT